MVDIPLLILSFLLGIGGFVWLGKALWSNFIEINHIKAKDQLIFSAFLFLMMVLVLTKPELR